MHPFLSDGLWLPQWSTFPFFIQHHFPSSIAGVQLLPSVLSCRFAFPTGTSMNGLEEPSIAKRLRGTPERIELENYRRSVRQVEELEEVPEETQAEHNLSSVLDKGTEEDVASRSADARGLPGYMVPRGSGFTGCPDSAGSKGT